MTTPPRPSVEDTRFSILPVRTEDDGAPAMAFLDERFARIRLLGAGAVGEVYLAHDQKLDREVALKVMKRVRSEAVPSLLDEARATSLVRHPNVVVVLDAGAHRGDVFIAFEYIEGTNLRRHAAADLPRQQALALLRDIAAGLAAAHAVDVLHLDVKPENVLVGVDGHARVLDFGLARLRVDGACVDVEGSSGTPAYMAPELWANEGVCDGTDVWSFAVLACELLTGQRLFEATSPAEIMATVLGARRVHAPAIHGLDPALWALLDAGLLRDRRARPLMRDLERALSVA